MSGKAITKLLREASRPPYLLWILIPFAISYLLFHRTPLPFAAQSQWMHLGSWVLGAPSSPGWDLFQITDGLAKWHATGVVPYQSYPVLYPPLTFLLFAPLTQVDFLLAYKILTCVTLAGFIVAAFVFPLRMSGEQRISPVLVLILATGLFSYGLQFELERGQFNLIAALLAFLAIWIFHRHPRYRFGAYVLFCLSVQLKLYPFIFVLMLVSDWHDWKANLKRVALLGIANVALLFVMGPSFFMAFVDAARTQTARPVWVEKLYFINSSLQSFVVSASSLASSRGLPQLARYSGLLQLGLLAIVAACLLLIMLRLYRHRSRGMDPYLLFACAIGAMIVPAISFDYKLPILAGPTALLLMGYPNAVAPGSRRSQVLQIILVFVISLAYSSILFSAPNKLPLPPGNFPPLFIMLLAATGLCYTTKPAAAETGPAAPPTNPAPHTAGAAASR